MTILSDNVIADVKAKLLKVWQTTQFVKHNNNVFFFTGTCGELKIFTRRVSDDKIEVIGSAAPIRTAVYSLEQFYELTTELVMDYV